MKFISRFASACLLLASFGVASSSSAQYLGLEVDAIDNQGVVPGTTYRVYAVMESEGDLIDAIFGDGPDFLIVESTKPFYQNDLGGDLAKDTQRSLSESDETLKYDSWVTIGFEDNYMNALTGFMIDFSEFATGGRIFSDNGAWFVTPDMLQARAGKDKRILIMQLTTEGEVSGMLNIHGRTRSKGLPGAETFEVIEARGVPFAFGGDRSSFEGGLNNENVVAIDAMAEDGMVSTERASLIKSYKAPGDVSFNQVPKDVVVSTVAVLPIDGKDCNGQVVSGQDIASFTEGALLGLYNIVERRNLERVLEEQRLALSGIVYEKSAVEAGCNVGAQGIIFTEYGCLTGQETIQLKLVDCATSELYWSCTGVNATAKETLDKVREELEKK